MKGKLLILGAGMYGVVAKEIAQSTGRFSQIDFLDDIVSVTPGGDTVVGTLTDLDELAESYTGALVAIGASEIRLRMLGILESVGIPIVTLISPHAYVAPSARIAAGTIIEPMAVVHSGCVLERGCIVSAGAVVNHFSTCQAGVHVDCNATVAGDTVVPNGMKILSGSYYESANAERNA